MNFSTVSLVNIVKRDPAVAHVLSYTGNGNAGFMFIALKPLGTSCKEGPNCDVRQTSAMDVINRLRAPMNRLPVASAILQPGQDIRMGGRGSAAPCISTPSSPTTLPICSIGGRFCCKT